MSNPYNNRTDLGFTLITEKISEWDVYQRFLELNPDVKERYEVHKTYEILKDDNRNR